MSERLSDNRERDVVCQELSRVISSHILVRHFRDFDNLQRVSPDSVSRGHLRVQSVHRRIHSRFSVLFVRVVKPNSGLVTNPNPVVLHRRVVLLKNLVARDDLTVRFLHLSQSREKVPKLRARSRRVQGPKFHAVHLRSRFLLRRDASTNDLILVVLFIDTKKKKKKKKKIILVSHCEKKKNETQCLEREAATRDERALTRTSPRREKNAFSSLKRGTPNVYRTRAERNHHRRARLRSNRRVDVVASTRRRVFSARQFFPPSHFFRVDEFPFAVTILRERGLEKRVPERNDATVERASDAQKRVVRYRFVSIPAVLALFRRVRRPRTPSPGTTHARARPTIAVSMSRIVAQKTREQERKEDDANRATVSSLSRRERKQRTYAKRCH